MKKLTIALGISILFLYSCSEQEDGRVSDFDYVIDIDNAETTPMPVLISEFCDSVTTIIPDTINSTFLHSVMTILHVKDRIYILDRDFRNRLSSVMEFDMDGLLVRKYGNVGRGPGEYLGASDFAVDEAEYKLFLLDERTQRLLTYDRDTGKYLSTTNIGNGNTRSNAVSSVGDVLYTNLLYRRFDKSNYMLRSWHISDPQDQNYYLHVAEHLEGWTNTSLSNNGGFIYKSGEYSLFSDKFSNEIFKQTSKGLSNHVYVESKSFIGKNGRRVMSDAYHRDPAVPPDPSKDSSLSLWDLDCWYGLGNYFETETYISFMASRRGMGSTFLYDKNRGTTTMFGYPHLDLIIKKEYPEVHSVFSFLQADEGGIFYIVRSENIEALRTAAQEEMLVDELDDLGKIKQLADDTNPVIFYVQFKDAI